VTVAGRIDNAWTEIAANVFARRYAALDQTLGLVVGASGCLVVDTGRDDLHGTELAAAIRTVTPLPWTAVITHAHWDHFFGTSAFLPCPVWAHQRCRLVIADHADEMRERGLRYYDAQGDPRSAATLSTATAVVPTDVFADEAVVDLGDRSVTLSHLGRGHTDNDVVVVVQDDAVVFAGDLVEQGAPPVIGADAYPMEWPSTMDRLLSFDPHVVVPGHGEPVDAAFVRTQREELAAVGELVRAVAAGELTEQEAVRRSPYPEDATLPALRRPSTISPDQPTTP